MKGFWTSRAQIVMVPVAGPEALWLSELSSEPPHATAVMASAPVTASALICLIRTALLLLLTVVLMASGLSRRRDPHAHRVGAAVAPAEVGDRGERRRLRRR